MISAHADPRTVVAQVVDTIGIGPAQFNIHKVMHFDSLGLPLWAPTSSVYAATKAAVRSMARTFSSAYVSRGIRFNAVSPGPIETPIWNRGGIPLEAVEGTKKAITELNPMKRCGTLDEVCAVVTFLLSPESTYMLGAEIVVDGGMTQL
jgi:NAD(P)-dependent dehydrogenase (short-subunit alcohol dehydrogenase family)